MSRSRSGDVYEAIRQDILYGRLNSGERLQINRHAKDLGVSLSVVREAVTRLASEGLLESVPQVGFRVKVLSVDDLDDLTRVRVNLETTALRESLRRGDLDWESSLVAAHHALRSTPIESAPGEWDHEWLQRHADFHHALCSACGSPWLLDLRGRLFDAAELYRFWLIRLHHRATLQKKRTKLIRDEHQKLLDVALARDEEAAVTQLTLHFETTYRRIRDEAQNGR